MLEITADTAANYLRRQGRIAGDEPVTVESLGGGVSNQVLLVKTSNQAFVLKQSRPQLRTRDAWFSDLERIWREQEVMAALHPLLPEPTVPKVLFADRENYLFAMACAPAAARPWKELLLGGTIDLGLGEHAGRILGALQQATAEKPDLLEPFRDHTAFVQLRVDPFYRRIQERRPEVAHMVAPIVEEMLTRKEALCHGDYTPKNMLVHSGTFTLVDYETAHFGDPAMDVGLCLAHLLLKAVRRPERREDFFNLTRAFWKGYGEKLRYRPQPEMQARGIAHLGVCLLARIDGTSPVDYLPQEPKREAVRRIGRTILLDRTRSWDEVLCLVEREIRTQRSI
jgi:5-methylthioribose kinase